MDQLRWLRKQQDLSQVELARLAGVDRTTINQTELGSRKPSTRTLEKLATALGAEVGDFFGPPLIRGSWLAAEGIEASGTELEIANWLIGDLWRQAHGHRPEAHFVPDEVNHDRVLMLITYAGSRLGELDWTRLEAARERLAAQ